MVLLLLGALLVGIALIALGRAVIAPRMRTSQNMAGIEQYGFSGTARIDDIETRSIVDGLASFVGNAVTGRFAFMREEELRQHIVSAAMYRVSPRQLAGYQVLGAIVLPAFWIWLATTNGMGTLLFIAGTALMAAIGWIGPVSYVKGRAKKRLAEVDYALPELIDLVVVSLEAGIGFAAALNVAADRIPGPLGEELRLANQEQRMGLVVAETLENIQKRCPTDTVKSFVRAVVQGERLGVSMGQIMRNLALEMRLRRRQLAEEKAHKAPVKMLFPLVFMIFPAMFLVLLGPAMYQIVDTLGK